MDTIAECSCGSVRVTINGNGMPLSVVACHCIACQRRTGSVFGVGAYYPAEQVMTAGQVKLYTRGTNAGHTFTSYFCPACGTSVYWESGKNPGLLGVAVGAIANPQFPAPVRSVWEQSQHPWVRIEAAVQHFSKGR